MLSKYVPAHVNTLHCFGGLVLTPLLIQGASGLALTIYFRFTVVEAFESVEAIIESIDKRPPLLPSTQWLLVDLRS